MRTTKGHTVHALGGLALLICGSSAHADSGAPWKADGVTQGVTVEHRDVRGSHFDELRLSTVSSLSLQSLCDAIYPKSLPTKLERRFKKLELLRQTETERWTYEQISVPVVSDRDYVMHATLEQPASSGRCAVSFATTEDASHPPAPGFVRIPVIRGHWDVFPLANGQVAVQYEIFSEPGGGVPAFLASGKQKSAAIDFMKIILARASSPDTPAAR